MSAEKQLSPPARRVPLTDVQVLCRKFPTLDPVVVEDVFLGLAHNKCAIIDVLTAMSNVPDPATIAGQPTSPAAGRAPSSVVEVWCEAFPTVDASMVSDVVGKLAPDDNAINDVLARLSNPEYPTMSAGQSADNTHNREFFVTMYPHLDRNVVIAEVEKLQGEETTVIMKKLDILSRVEDPDVLRGCAYWMAQNHEMPQFSIFKIPRDGNCAFHALVKWYSLLFEGKISVTQLKDQIITEIEGGSRVSFIQEMRFDNEYDNIHDNNEMLASYAKKLRENQMWGGTPEFKLVANMWGVRIQVWTSFDNYVHNLKDKLPNSVSLYQASLGVDYVCYPDNCFGSDATRTVHLLYSGSSHYDCLLPQ